MAVKAEHQTSYCVLTTVDMEQKCRSAVNSQQRWPYGYTRARQVKRPGWSKSFRLVWRLR